MKASKFLAIAICMAVLALAASFPVSSYGALIYLDFGNVSAPEANNTGPHTISYTNVGWTGPDRTGISLNIDAELVASGPWGAFRSDISGDNTFPHGSVSGDIRVFADWDQTVSFSLNLLDATTGDPYDATGDEWRLIFFDIDGAALNATNGLGDPTWDEVTVFGGTSYTVSPTTNLIITGVSGGVNFSGETVGGNVDGQTGLTPPLTQAQKDVAVEYLFTGVNSVQFDYIVGKNPLSTDDIRGRNLLVDGGTLTGAIPIPGAVWLLGSGLVGLIAIRRRFKS